MYCIKSCLFAGASLALAIVATSAPSAAQTTKGEDGIGAGAGNSPPIDQLRGGAAMPDAASKMDAPPMPPDDGADRQHLDAACLRPIRHRPTMARRRRKARPIRTEI